MNKVGRIQEKWARGECPAKFLNTTGSRPVTSRLAMTLVLCVILAGLTFSCLGDESTRLRRLEPRSPREAIETIRTLEGFRVEQVAAEPLVRDPIAMEFDEFGRAYVIELTAYNQYAKEPEQVASPGSTIRLLEDTNGDGSLEKSQIFYEDLNYATGIACYEGGVFVGDAPDLLYLKDTDGDGRADVREVLFSGFGQDRAGEGQLNSFRWGLDNRLYISTGLNGGDVRPVGAPDAQPWQVRRRGFVLDPRSRSVELTSGGGQHGRSFDDWGRTLVCGNSEPALLLIYDDRYLNRNPWMMGKAPVVSIVPEGKFTKVMRISPVDPWRLIRTRMRTAGQFAGSDEGGQAAGFFTGGTGVTIYRGGAWPEHYHGSLLVGEASGNLVYRARLESDGLSLIARRADPETEFLASTDTWFRPVQFTHGPDGALYVLDMYRELIEGAAFLPPELLAQMDVTAGNDRGRIYRIVPEDFNQPVPVSLGARATVALVPLLEHRNGWHRDTAARLIYERQDAAAIEPLRSVAVNSAFAQGRMHALYGLQGLGALQEADVLRALDDPHPQVRRHAVLLAEAYAATSAKIQHALVQMVDDPHLLVRFQVAFTLGEAPDEIRKAALVELIRKDGSSHWFQLAVQSSLGDGATGVLQPLLANEAFRSSAHGVEFLTTLAQQIGRANDTHEIDGSVQAINQLSGDEKIIEPLARSLVRALLQNRQSSEARRLLVAGDGRTRRIVTTLLSQARATAVDASRSDEERADAVRTLNCGSFTDGEALLTKLLQPRQSQAVQQAVLATLATFSDEAVADLVLQRWASLTPQLRSTATEVLLGRPVWSHRLLDAVQNEQVRRSELDPARWTLLRSHPDQELRQRAAQVFPAEGRARRADVVADYQKSLKLDGDATRGRHTFRKFCAACHRLEGFGNAIGADLKAVHQRGMESVLLNILDPNRDVKPQFITYLIAKSDGQVITGVIAEETTNGLTLRQPDGSSVTVARVDIDEDVGLRSTGLSYMPEGLEKEIDHQAMADLLLYLSAPEKRSED